MKHIDIPVCFLQEQYDNGQFITKYDKYILIPADMCTKPFSGPIFCFITKWITGFHFYSLIDTEYYQLVILQTFEVR